MFNELFDNLLDRKGAGIENYNLKLVLVFLVIKHNEAKNACLP